MSEVGTGLCIAYGGSNARSGMVDGNHVNDFESQRTLSDPTAFFNGAAATILEAHSNGAEWAVIGVPGLVEQVKGQIIMGPVTNVPGLSRDKYNLHYQLSQANPTLARIIGNGYQIIGVNDGPLAAHAATSVADPDEKRIGALIDGTGVGFGAVERDEDDDTLFHTIHLPLEIGHMPYGNDPKITIEQTISGPALEKAYGISPEYLGVGSKAWKIVGKTLARLTISLGCTNGIDLIVPTGGVGAGASVKYDSHFYKYLERFVDVEGDDRTIREQLVPRTELIHPDLAQQFELNGAIGVVRAYRAALKSKAIKN
jgi:hypothetical protein